MAREDYAVALGSFLRQLRFALGDDTPVFVSRASGYRQYDCPDNADPACFKTCPAVTRAQEAAVDPGRHVFAGPDTDQLVPFTERPDGYHFSAKGADAFASAWLPILGQGRHDK
jgi:hypothetical protein